MNLESISGKFDLDYYSSDRLIINFDSHIKSELLRINAGISRDLLYFENTLENNSLLLKKLKSNKISRSNIRYIDDNNSCDYMIDFISATNRSSFVGLYCFLKEDIFEFTDVFIKNGKYEKNLKNIITPVIYKKSSDKHISESLKILTDADFEIEKDHIDFISDLDTLNYIVHDRSSFSDEKISSLNDRLITLDELYSRNKELFISEKCIRDMIDRAISFSDNLENSINLYFK